MLAGFLQPVRLVVSVLIAHDSPRQLAAGISLGMLLGMVPKGNLTAVVLAGALFSLRVNRGAGLASAIAFSWLGMFLDPLAHRVGWQILSLQPLQHLFAACFELPLVPWSGLNNTVVVGQLVLGLYAVYPVYRLSLQLSQRWRDEVAEWLATHRPAALAGADDASRLELGE